MCHARRIDAEHLSCRTAGPGKGANDSHVSDDGYGTELEPASVKRLLTLKLRN
jgi:hypothetical protein